MVLKDPVYVGFGVCSHKADVLETAIFSNVKLEATAAPAARAGGGGGNARGRSEISVYDMATNSVEVIYTASGQHFEAPNWSPDAKYLLLNSAGSLWRLAIGQPNAAPVKIDLGTITGCNNDHGISPDGKMLAISAQMNKQPSQVFVAAADGSGGNLMTPLSPS